MVSRSRRGQEEKFERRLVSATSAAPARRLAAARLLRSRFGR
jgi:hypothetical protein